MPRLDRVLTVVLCLASTVQAGAQDSASVPTYEQIGGHVQAGLDALAGRPDSALALLGRLAAEGAVVVHEAATDSAFARLRSGPEWSRITASIEASRQPIGSSRPAFELAGRDLTAEGTAWDSKTGTLFLSSLYKRKIVAIARDGTPRDFIAPGRDGIGPVVGLEVDPSRRGLWAASMGCRKRESRWRTPRSWRTGCSSTTTWTPADCAVGTCCGPQRAGATASTT
jgi:hypothetical protein